MFSGTVTVQGKKFDFLVERIDNDAKGKRYLLSVVRAGWRSERVVRSSASLSSVEQLIRLKAEQLANAICQWHQEHPPEEEV